MKTIIRSAFQGDIMIRRVKAVAKSFIKQKRNGRLVIAHSETGHHHAIDDMNVSYFTNPQNPLICYLKLEDGCGSGDGINVVHHRAWDTHETLHLLGQPGDVWEVRRQREYTPEGWRKVMD